MMRKLLLGGIVATAAALIGGPLAPAATTETNPTVASPAKAPPLTPEQTAFFEGKIRPILANNCYKCHSVEQGKAKGDLVLDSREGWLKGGENGTAIIPGNPGKSLLITAVSYTDKDLQMPPKGEKLTDLQIADLTEWVQMGAPDPRTAPAGVKLTGLNDKAKAHWAYQPVKMPEVPAVVSDKAWVKTPIDAFILKKLDGLEMKPQKAAGKETILRRATFDLIGLPPTPAEIKAFVNDNTPKAFEKVVDRLLASPHYGERWGRYWLDTARYSDTTGAETENRAESYRFAYAWTYRDWVIKAMNEDMPYNQFLLEQIAADQLPGFDKEKDKDNLAALGFLTVGKRFPNINDTIDERIDTVSKATMALTVSCARCHDHKFDPIPTQDYYSLHGIFASCVDPKDDEKPVIGRPPTPAELADFTKRLGMIEAKNRDIYFGFVEEKDGAFRKKASIYLMAALYGKKGDKGDAKEIAAKRQLIADHNLDVQMLNGLAPLRKEHEAIFGPLVWFEQLPADQISSKAPEVLDRIAKAGEKKQVNPLVAAAFKSVKPESIKEIKDVTAVYDKIFAGVDSAAKQYMQAARTSTATSGNVATKLDPATLQLVEYPVKAEPAGAMTTEHIRDISNKLLLGNNPAQRFLFNAINELELTNPGAPGHAMVLLDSPKPHDSPVFIHGEQNNRGPVAPRRFLEIVAGKERQPFKIGSGRLELAQAIATKDNPLTVRALINRVWMHHFGEGFVRTPDDLGVQSEPPTHPELIDYLASRFVEEGWSLKKLHREIMLSSVYQESSETNEKFALKDPDNKYLWRANLRRLDFEAIRDTMLQFTGHLDPSVGGRPVNLTDEPYSYRRSIYGYIDRGNVPELLQQFDFGDPNRPNSHRTSTIVPQQALFFMNSPMSADVARKVCERPEFLNARDDYARVWAIYEVLLQRQPKGAEVVLARDFYNAHIIGKKKGGIVVTDVPYNQPRPQERNAADMKKAMDDKMMANMMNNNGKAAIHNEGETVERGPLTIWEQYAQSLLFTNEIAYVN